MYTVCMRISSHESSLNTDCEKKIVTAKLRSTRKSNIRVEFNRRADSRARRVFSRLSKRTFLHAFSHASPLHGQNPLQAMRTDVWWMQLWYSSRHGELYVRLSFPQRNVGFTTGHS